MIILIHVIYERLCIIHVLIVAEQRHKALQEYEPDLKIIQLFYASKQYSMNTISSQLIEFVSKSTLIVEFDLTDFYYALSNYFVKFAKSLCLSFKICNKAMHINIKIWKTFKLLKFAGDESTKGKWLQNISCNRIVLEDNLLQLSVNDNKNLIQSKKRFNRFHKLSVNALVFSILVCKTLINSILVNSTNLLTHQRFFQF